MAVFGDYARYYNLLYADKDYAAETAFVLRTLASQGCRPASLLDLGCGTGRHALSMARHGSAVTGVDLSATMLEMGKAYLAGACARQPLPPDVPRPDLIQGDARAVRLRRSFDAVTSLFHVMSYQNVAEDALALFATAHAHLRPGGLFLFDFWHGPGVLTDPPTERIRKMEDRHTFITRHARPVHHVSDNVVEVHYQIEIEDKATGARSALHEQHNMRYWFLPELRYLASQEGFTVVGEGEWLSAELPTAKSWKAWVLVRKC